MNLREQAEKCIEKENFPEAAKLLSKWLDESPEDPKALFLIGYCFMKSEGSGLAMNIFQRAGELFPAEAAIWHNIGKVYHDLNNDEKAEEYFRKALTVNPSFYNSLEGLGMTHLNKSQFKEAIYYCNLALAEEPTATEARTNRGMAYLAQRRWHQGWSDYNANVGRDKNRVIPQYESGGLWDGTKGLDVVVFGEQGIGDEISFASCIPDAIRDCKSVTIESDGRLKRLFARSFGVETHGTRYSKDDRSWVNGRKFDAYASFGQLAQIYRNRDQDFPKTSYLKPNPVMAVQWRALLDSLGKKPKIGISWTGGLVHTGTKRRSVPLDTFAPLFKEFDADWISLQYKEADTSAAGKYGVTVHDWEWGTRVYDYDQTAALVSELDLVVSVTTAVVDLCAAIGTECYCLVPSQPIWRHGIEGSDFLWGKSVKLFRQEKDWPITSILRELHERFAGRSN